MSRNFFSGNVKWSGGERERERERDYLCYRFFLFEMKFLLWSFLLKIDKTKMRNDMSTIFLQQILSDRLLLVIIVGAKK